MYRFGIGIIAAVFIATLAGCYESTDVTVHEAGVYKGSSDPLLNTEGSARAEALSKRFALVQADR